MRPSAPTGSAEAARATLKAMAGPDGKITTATLRARKGGGKGSEETGGEKVAVLTAYDVVFARLADEAGIDIVLVGDSLGMVVQGDRSTLAVTLDDMVYHTRIVARGVRRAHLVADMPFMSYQASVEDGMRAAGRLMKEGHAEAVKLEGGVEIAELVHKLVRAGIPVMGHVGLTPQSVHQLGGFKIQGRTNDQRAQIMAGARSCTISSASSRRGSRGSFAATPSWARPPPRRSPPTRPT